MSGPASSRAEALSARHGDALRVVTVLGATLTLGFAPIFAKLALASGVGPVAIAGWRLAIAAGALTPPLLLERARARRAEAPSATAAAPWSWSAASPRSWPWPLLLPGVLFAGDLATWHLAFERTTAANATVLANTSVLLVSAAGYLLGERFDWRLPVGAGVGLIGVASLIGLSFSGAAEGQVWGDLLSLGTALCYTAYILDVKWLRGRHGTLPILVASSAVGALVCFPLAAAWGERLVPRQAAGWAYLLALGLVCHVLGQGLITVTLRRLPASLVSVLLLTQPVHVVWLGWLLLDETLGLGQLGSMALVLVGVALAILGRRPPASAAPPEAASG